MSNIVLRVISKAGKPSTILKTLRPIKNRDTSYCNPRRS